MKSLKRVKNLLKLWYQLRGLYTVRRPRVSPAAPWWSPCHGPWCKRLSTATCIPMRSPIQVLTGLNLALLQLWDENWCIQDEWLLTCANAKILDPIQVWKTPEALHVLGVLLVLETFWIWISPAQQLLLTSRGNYNTTISQYHNITILEYYDLISNKQGQLVESCSFTNDCSSPNILSVTGAMTVTRKTCSHFQNIFHRSLQIYCGFCSNRIMPHFPLSVFMYVSHRHEISTPFKCLIFEGMKAIYFWKHIILAITAHQPNPLGPCRPTLWPPGTL